MKAFCLSLATLILAVSLISAAWLISGIFYAPHKYAFYAGLVLTFIYIGLIGELLKFCYNQIKKL